jgi:hypothetical protein
MEENLSKIFYKQIMDAENPTQVLILFIRKVFDYPVDNRLYGIVGKLNKLYGRELVFFAILDSSNFDDMNSPQKLYNVISYYCKKRLESSIIAPTKSLEDMAKTNMEFLDDRK